MTKMHAAHLTKTLALTMFALTAIAIVAPSPAASAASTCNIEADDNSSLAPCYENELEEKTKANDKFYRQIIKKAKPHVRVKKGKKLKAKEKAKVKVYADFIERMNNTMIDGRKAALRSCVRMTGKFQDKELSDSAIANCRTQAELQLEKQLVNYDAELKNLIFAETKN